MTLNIAHRGASAYAPENTMAAFEKAVELGADVLELDLHLTLDNELVVIHDDSLDRTTDGRGPVHERSLNEISGWTPAGGLAWTLWASGSRPSPRSSIALLERYHWRLRSRRAQPSFLESKKGWCPFYAATPRSSIRPLHPLTITRCDA